MPTVVAGVLAGVLLVVLGVGGAVLLLNGRNDGDSAGAAPVARTSTSSTSPEASKDPGSAASSAPPASSATPRQAPAGRITPRQPALGPVTALPTGLFCRDLFRDGYSYVAAVDYWNLHGEPNQMDADRNGIPCETVYEPSDVSAYWSVRDLPARAVGESADLPSGLLCRDLLARGVSYPDAVSYWWSEGDPPRMDIDHDGYPCGTVYPTSAIASFW